MATNRDTGWILKQAMFQNAIEGEDVKNRLIECLDILNTSHELRINDAVKDKVTTYIFRNTNTKAKSYEVTVTVRVLYNDGESDINLDKDIVIKYDKATKSKPKKLNDRLKIYYNGGVWDLTWLMDSNDHQKEDGFSWPADYVSSSPILTTTFPAITE